VLNVCFSIVFYLNPTIKTTFQLAIQKIKQADFILIRPACFIFN